jgi:hypothetical protein
MDALDIALYPQQQHSTLSTAAKAGIAVASAVAGAAILAAAAIIIVRHKRRQQAAAAAALLPVHTKPDNVERSSGSGGSSSDGAHGSYSKPDGATPHSTMPTSQESAGSVPSSFKGHGVSLLTASSRCSLSMPSILKGTLSAQQAAELQLGEWAAYGMVLHWQLVCIALAVTSAG